VPGPGGIGRVRATGPDSTKLSVGDWVFCDPTIRSRDDAIRPDMMLLGWTAVGAAALPLHRCFHNGTFTEQVLLPTENVTPIGEIEVADAGRWCVLSSLLVPYGGLLAGDLQPGETLVVNGATGGFGSAGIVVALAMGAGKVVATGRNERALEDLVRRFGPRVRRARMTGDEEDDRRLIGKVAGGPIDLVLDLLPREASSSQVLAAVFAVRPGGRVVLMGGVGRQGGNDLALPYPLAHAKRHYSTRQMDVPACCCVSNGAAGPRGAHRPGPVRCNRILAERCERCCHLRRCQCRSASPHRTSPG